MQSKAYAPLFFLIDLVRLTNSYNYFCPVIFVISHLMFRKQNFAVQTIDVVNIQT